MAALAIHDAVAEVAPAIATAARDQMAERPPARGREIRRHPDRRRGRRRTVAVGIGVNCTSHPADTDYPATDLAAAGADVIGGGALLRAVGQDDGAPRTMEPGRAFRHHPHRLALARGRSRRVRSACGLPTANSPACFETTRRCRPSGAGGSPTAAARRSRPATSSSSSALTGRDNLTAVSGDGGQARSLCSRRSAEWARSA